MLELLSLIATSILAAAAVWIALKANSLASRSVRVEVDKLIFDWGQRCLYQLSQASSLRLMSGNDISKTDFNTRRREIRAGIFALKEEGALFFVKSGNDSGANPALDAMDKVANIMNGGSFKPSEGADFDSYRKPQNNVIRAQARRLIEAVQARVSDEWADADN